MLRIILKFQIGLNNIKNYRSNKQKCQTYSATIRRKRAMKFTESIQICLKKYAKFNGRATRSEFWWWVLFTFLFSACSQLLSQKLGSIFSLAVFLPSIAVTSRRLHDIGRSGWWQLIGLIPIIGWVIMIFWGVKESSMSNEYDR